VIDIENDLRRRFDDAVSDVSASPDLLDAIEHRIVAQGRRAAALRVAAVVAVLGLTIGAGVAIASRGGGGDTTFATDPTASSTPSRGPGTWATMADAPLASRFQHAAVAMGDEVLVTSGLETGPANLPTDAAVYDTAAETWRTVPDAPLFPGGAVGVWTGEEALLVSAEHGGDGPTPTSARKAAAFDPDTDTWRELAAPPPGAIAGTVTHTVWTGSEMVVATPGWGDEGKVLVYDPDADAWREASALSSPLPDLENIVWTGSEVAMVGYEQPADADRGMEEVPVGEMVVALYDPAADTWRTIPWGLDGARLDPAVGWTGTHVFVGGGEQLPGDAKRTDGALLDPATGEWTPIAEAPSAYGGPATWTGAEIITSEFDRLTPLRYDPVADMWTVGATQPGEVVYDAPTVWSAGRLVTPLGGYETVHETDDDGTPSVIGCCDHGPSGGLTYTP